MLRPTDQKTIAVFCSQFQEEKACYTMQESHGEAPEFTEALKKCDENIPKSTLIVFLCKKKCGRQGKKLNSLRLAILNNFLGI